MNLMRIIIPNIHREGYYFVVVFAVISLIVATFFPMLGIIGAIATIWCVYFFRDPDRVTPVRKNLVISPADGLLQKITNASPPEELNIGSEEMIRVSIFLNIFNVHVNRVPIDGIIKALHYRPGKFLNASLDKASEDNERQSVYMETADGKPVVFVQIAGLIARRIVCYLKEDKEVKAGERYGIIRFGSRADIYLPIGTNLLVMEGQQIIGGETVIADFDSNEGSRMGEIREEVR